MMSDALTKQWGKSKKWAMWRNLTISQIIEDKRHKKTFLGCINNEMFQRRINFLIYLY